jgi:hypothetical protein
MIDFLSFIPVFSPQRRSLVTHKDKFSFLYRLNNIFIYIQSNIVSYIFDIGNFDVSERYHIPQAFLVINKVWGLEFPRPSPNNLYLLGKIFIFNKYLSGSLANKNPKEDPELKNLYDSFEKIIFFSLGTINRLNKEEYEYFFNYFEKLNDTLIVMSIRREFQKILPTRIPQNIKIFEWINQEYTLSHKNIKIFISHGGANGNELFSKKVLGRRCYMEIK